MICDSWPDRSAKLGRHDGCGRSRWRDIGCGGTPQRQDPVRAGHAGRRDEAAWRRVRRDDGLRQTGGRPARRHRDPRTVRDLAGTPRHHPASRRVPHHDRRAIACRTTPAETAQRGRTGRGHPPRARQACRTCRARRRMLHLRAIAHLLRGRRLVGHGGGRRHRRLRQPAARHACPHERDRRETGTRRHADRPRCRRTRRARRTTRTTARAMAARLRAARRIQPGHQRGISGPIPPRSS